MAQQDPLMIMMQQMPDMIYRLVRDRQQARERIRDKQEERAFNINNALIKLGRTDALIEFNKDMTEADRANQINKAMGNGCFV